MKQLADNRGHKLDLKKLFKMECMKFKKTFCTEGTVATEVLVDNDAADQSSVSLPLPPARMINKAQRMVWPACIAGWG